MSRIKVIGTPSKEQIEALDRIIKAPADGKGPSHAIMRCKSGWVVGKKKKVKA